MKIFKIGKNKEVERETDYQGRVHRNTSDLWKWNFKTSASMNGGQWIRLRRVQKNIQIFKKFADDIANLAILDTDDVI